MLSWQVGAVRITRVVEAEIPVAFDPEGPFITGASPEALRTIDWLYPDFVDEQDRLRLSFHALLVEAPGMRLMVDTCFGHGKHRNALGSEDLMRPFLDDLERAGWPPESVDAVICTHLHFDHVGWNTVLRDGRLVPTFPNARYLFGRTEYQHWMETGDEDQQEVLSHSIKPVFDAGLAELVDCDYRISPEIRLVPTRGHTPGHVSVVIESKGQCAVITGDMAHHPCQLSHPEWVTPFDSDNNVAIATRKEHFAEWAADQRLVIGTHFAAPTAGRIVPDEDGFRLLS